MSDLTIDQLFLLKARADARKTRMIGVLLILGGAALQLLHLLDASISGFKIMVIVAGVITAGSGILFILGSTTVPKNRGEFVRRFQKAMLDTDPDRRLWGAQSLIGYMKQANFTKEDILRVARYTAAVIENPPVADKYKEYIAGDHLLLLREMAVSVDIDKHTRKDFVRIIRPLMKMKNLSSEAYELLADAVSYHPDKLPIQAFSDLQKIKEEDDIPENED